MRFIVVVLTAATVGTLSASAATIQSEGPVFDAAIVGPISAELGAWRTKVQLVFDPATRTLTRRTYSVWDPEPSRNLDFAWTPDRPATDKPGQISGDGYLVWRFRDRPAYDRASIYSEYRGTLRNGRANGNGSYLDHTGLMYQGKWKYGLADGHGSLTLPGGDEYVGSFRAGKANGHGRIIDLTGEIYEGPYANGHRHGRGMTTLPNGRQYASLWINGRESERSRLVRIAQSGGGTIPVSADDIRIGISVDRRLPPQSPNSGLRAGVLWYATSNQAATIQIRPANNRLMSMWQGQGQLQLTWKEENHEWGNLGVFGFIKEQLVPLSLRIEVQNRSRSTVQVAGIYLDVQNSSTENKPAIQVRLNSGITCAGHPEFSPGFTLDNLGWGAAENATLRLKPTVSSSTFNISKTIGNLDRSVSLDLEPELKAVGVDTAYLREISKEGFVCRSQSDRECLQRLRFTGKLGQLASMVEVHDAEFLLKLASVLEYSWRDVKGNKRDWSHSFTATMPIGFIRQEVECGEAGGPQVITTKTQELKLDTSGYRIPVAYQTSIQAGRTTPLILSVSAPKSSTHGFTVVLQLADGREIRSRPIDLLYYHPRWTPNDIDPQQETADQTPDSSSNTDEESSIANYDIVGPDLRQIRNSDTDRCSNACDADNACRAYVYDAWIRACTLKSAANLLRFDPRYSSGFKKGSVKPAISTAGKIIELYRNQTLSGDSYLEDSYRVDMRSTLEECQQRCLSDDQCLAFNFNKRSRDCYLIENAGASSPNSNTDSGVKRQPVN